MHLFPSLTVLATAFTALTTAVALPQSGTTELIESRTFKGGDDKKCLREEDANTLRDAYVRMISLWNPADAKYLTEDFRDTSGSINIFIGKPLDGSVATFATKAEFLQHMTVAVSFVLCSFLRFVYLVIPCLQHSIDLFPLTSLVPFHLRFSLVFAPLFTSFTPLS